MFLVFSDLGINFFTVFCVLHCAKLDGAVAIKLLTFCCKQPKVCGGDTDCLVERQLIAGFRSDSKLKPSHW